MTPTATYADILLPATTVFEYDSVMAGTRNHYVQLIEKAVEPQGEAKPDYVIFGELAKRLGFGDRYIVPVEQMIRNVLKPSGITYNRKKQVQAGFYGFVRIFGNSAQAGNLLL